MPVTTVETQVSERLFADIEAFLSEAEAAPWRVPNLIWTMVRVVSEQGGNLVVREALPAIYEGGGIIEGEVVSVEYLAPVAAAFGGLWVVIAMLALVDILLLIGCFHGLLKTIFSHMPNWFGARNKLVGVVDLAFKWDIAYAHWVADKITAAIIDVVRGLIFIVHLFSGQVHSVKGKPTYVKPGTVPQAIINDVHQLQARMGRIENEINSASHANSSISGSLSAQLHTIHQQVADLYHSVRTTDASLHKLYNEHYITAGELHNLEHTVSDISSKLKGVRAVHVSAPDLLTQLDAEIQRLEKWRPDVERELNHITSTLTQLAPLAVLLTGGMSGLRMLRTLEDEPCQCEPSVPQKAPTTSTDDIWGLYEFYSEG